jgi:NAD(P)H-dependent flavin oxidoreductase YrpB (nitropropane dioxygenase family)
MFKGLEPIRYAGREILPLLEGGKGLCATDHLSSGAWAAAGGIGTISAVNADSYDADGQIIPQDYHAATRPARHEELVHYAIDGAVAQVRRAFERSDGKGAININILWEMGGAQRVLRAILEQTCGMVAGVTCGAGMPYRLAEIAAANRVSYWPIVSSARAFDALWKRAYSKSPEWLAGVVYEDPWKAGGHNGLSNADDPSVPQHPYPRVRALRETMRLCGLSDRVPIVMAGGVWCLREWEDWIGNSELGQIAWQFGTRPLLTRESPISDAWKARLTTLGEGDVLLHRFSPTGFYSSAVRNDFLNGLVARSDRQIAFARQATLACPHELDVGAKTRHFWVSLPDLERARHWHSQGHTQVLKTPEDTLIFVTSEEAGSIRHDQAACTGCLSHCSFSSWSDGGTHSTGRLADPRSFCIQKTLQDIAHGGSVDNNLMFAGHSAFRFRRDPFYDNGFVPTVQQLIDRICRGD